MCKFDGLSKHELFSVTCETLILMRNIVIYDTIQFTE